MVNWLSDDDMLPYIVPSARIFTFTWDSDYYSNAPVVRIRDVADTLLRKLQDKRDEVEINKSSTGYLISGIGEHALEAPYFSSFVLWGTYRHESQTESLENPRKLFTKGFQALEIANISGSEYQKLVLATSGVVFLGSPLQGTRAGTAAQWRAMLGGILNNSPSQTLLQDLDGHTKVLRDTSEEFLKIITGTPMQTMTMCFWESKKTQLAKAVLPTWISSHLASTEIIVGGLLTLTEHS